MRKVDVYETIKENIIYGKYGPGERLVEIRLMEELRSGRLHVREALTKLGHEGLLEISPNKGAVVKKMSLEEADQSYSVLAVLESYAAELATPYITDGRLTELQEINAEVRRYALGKDFWGYIRENLRFHLFLPRLSGNLILIDLITNLRNRNLVYSYAAHHVQSFLMDYVDKHTAIIEACHTKDPTTIREAVENHIATVRGNLMKSYAQKHRDWSQYSPDAGAGEGQSKTLQRHTKTNKER
jgi:GntR family transcriptional regulator, rspAB operon transcriptional repressor